MIIVGLISGTSADGIDAALCEVSGAPPHMRARVLHSLTHLYPDGVQARVHEACLPERSGVDRLTTLNAELGEYFAQAAQHVIESAGYDTAQVDLIGSHGQTVWHQIEPDGRATGTIQLAEGSIIAERTGITTICNFRNRDIAAGGQGAPLTSYLDWLLLRHPTQWRAVQNLGGIGNVTFLPPLTDERSTPLAFDTGPSNALIDSAVVLLSGGARRYDAGGALAAQGTVDEAWLAALLDHPYYRRRPPKTTGRELFGMAMAADLIEEGRARGLSDADVLATLTALTAASVADAYQRFAPAPIAEVILGGGGTQNPTLVRLLRARLDPVPVRTHEEIGISSDHKEALVFALLAHETWHNRPGVHPALTGARHATVLGQITPGANYADLLRRTWCVE